MNLFSSNEVIKYERGSLIFNSLEVIIYWCIAMVNYNKKRISVLPFFVSMRQR